MNIKEIKVMTREGTRFRVEKQVALLSGFLKDHIEKLEDEIDENEESPVLLLENVSEYAFRKVVRFCQQHIKEPMKAIEVPSKGDYDDVNVVSPWDQEFLDVKIEELIEIVQASTLLKVDDLFELSCFKIAHMIKGRKPEEIREILKIQNDLSELESKKLKEENLWLEES